jgi:alginate O-acetyltransferase complex protein AlgI
MKNLVIAIDGYSSCGKSTTAKAVAAALHYAYLDTGAMYRGVTLFLLENNIPLGGSRAGKFRTQLNVLIVFFLSGLWHGASWTFVLWGALHGFYLVAESLTAPARAALGRWLGLSARPHLQQALGTAVTVALVAYAWIFFRANTLPDAFYIATHLFSGWGHPTAQLPAALAGLGRHFVAELLVAAGAVALLTLVDYRAERGSVTAWLASWPAAGRWAGYAGLLLAMLYLGVFGSSQFIYFQF